MILVNDSSTHLPTWETQQPSATEKWNASIESSQVGWIQIHFIHVNFINPTSNNWQTLDRIENPSSIWGQGTRLLQFEQPGTGKQQTENTE